MKRSKADDTVKLNRVQSELLASYYDQFYKKLFYYAKASFRDSALAEEAVQETFHRACEKMGAFLSSQDPEGWLYRALKYVMQEMKNERKQIARLLIAISTLKSSDERVSFEGDRAVVNIHYAGLLKPKDFALLCRVSIDNYSMLEAAEEFGLTLENCKKRVQRKRKELSEQLKNL